MRILLAQEFGAGFGHLSALLEIAARLPGCEPVLAFPPGSINMGLIAARLGAGARVRHAPMLNVAPKPREDEDRTIADALARVGYADFGAVTAQAKAWQALVDEVAPDLIVADFAPTLQMIRRRAPLLLLGGWYTFPPAGRTLPSIKPWLPYVPPASRRREREMLTMANAARRQSGLPPLAHFADLFHGERSFVLCCPAFDGYRKYRKEPTSTAFNVPAIPRGPAFPERRGPTLFCYLHQDVPCVNLLLTALNGIEAPMQVFIRGVDPRLVASQVAGHIAVHQAPADFVEILPQTRLLIHYGASGTSYAGLLAGTPQLIISSNLEQEVNAHGVQTLGCGLSIRIAPGADVGELRGLIVSMLRDEAMQERAMAVAPEMAAIYDSGGAGRIAQACRELLGAA